MINKPHKSGCTQAKCEFCQTLINKENQCLCGKAKINEWEGVPHNQEKLLCRKNNWYLKWGKYGWEPAEATDPDAIEDLHRARIYIQEHSKWKGDDEYIID
jgi:hypothetical protein